MAKERTVPAFYPDFKSAETWKRWDGSREAEAWAALLQRRDEVLVDTAVELAKVGGPDTDIARLTSNLWAVSAADHDEIVELLESRWGEIRRRAEF